MKTLADNTAVPKNDYDNTATANNAVTLGLTAIADEFHVIDVVHGSYIGGTPAGTLAIATGGNELFKVGIDGEGDFEIEFPGGLHRGVVNELCAIVLSAGGAGTTGKLNVSYR